MRRFTRSPKGTFSLDLHVLGTPPAFILSRDQTLVFNLVYTLFPAYYLPYVTPSTIQFSKIYHFLVLNFVFKHACRFAVNYFLLFKELVVFNAVCFLLKISCVVKGDVQPISRFPLAI